MLPLKDAEFFHFDGLTVNQFILEKQVDMGGRICMIDSEKVTQDRWDNLLDERSTVIICPEVGFNFAILLLLSIIIAVAIYFLIDIPVSNTNGSEEADPMYTLRGQKNQVRLSQPIEKHYGKVRTWPSYMARPYNQFYDNDQYLFALLCVGLGEYDIEKIQIEDTDIEEFQDVTYEIYQPGEPVTLFPTNVQTSTEVSGPELYGPNEEDYEGWTGPFVACSAGSLAYILELDFSCRQGLYGLNSKGDAVSASVSVEGQYRLVDDAGDPLGDWVDMTPFTRTNSNSKAQRFTISIPVAAGRYEVQVRRTDDKSESFRVKHTINWEGLRAFCEAEQRFGNVTLLAIKARATDNLNDSSKNGFNVICTSILPVYDSETETWENLITRNPAWIAADILRAKYGRRLTSSTMDLPAFSTLAEETAAEGITFDGTFDQRGTIWSSLQTVLSVAYAVPVVPAGLISIVRDKPQSIPTLGFNGNNIGRDSVSVGTRLTKFADNDGLEVEYIDSETWKRRTVLCLIGTDQGTNPRQIKMLGCTDRDQAYRWGMYQRAVELYQTDNVVFETGLEGGTAVYGDLIAFKHELVPSATTFEPDQTGRLAADSFGTMVVEGDDVTTIRLQFAPVFEAEQVHRISVRDKLGVVRGPYLCTQHETEENTVVLETLLDTETLVVEEGSEQPLYWFGVSGREYTLCKIVKIASPELYKLQITAVPYDERIYAYAEATAPPLDLVYNTPVNPAAPVVTGLIVEPYPGSITQYMASWAPSLGATSYVVSKSTDGSQYVVVDTVFTANAVFSVDPGPLWVKVYAVNTAAGPAATWSGTVGSATTAPDVVEDLDVREEFVGETLYLNWAANILADSYRIQFFLGATLISEKTSTASETHFTLATATNAAAAAAVSLGREIGVKVRAENAIGDGPYTDMFLAENPLPSAPTGLTAGTPAGSDYPVSWDHGYEDDLKECKVYMSAVDGFTPGPSNLITTIPAPGRETTLTVPATRYWVVASVDKWGTEEVLSTQATITI